MFYGCARPGTNGRSAWQFMLYNVNSVRQARPTNKMEPRGIKFLIAPIIPPEVRPCQLIRFDHRRN